MNVRWLTAFIDTPANDAAVAEAFWLAVTGTTLSARRGEVGEFATLLPPTGDPILRVQVLHSGSPGVHLDLHVDDLDSAVGHASSLGAEQTSRADEIVVLRSPGGLSFCLVVWREDVAAHRPPPVRWPAGQSSLVDQVSLDIAPERWTSEVSFWSALTGWAVRRGERPEFTYLHRPGDMPHRLLLQRLGPQDPAGPVSAHIDLATTDRALEVARHVELGATVVGSPGGWTTLLDPAGRPYCVTDRDPLTGD